MYPYLLIVNVGLVVISPKPMTLLVLMHVLQATLLSGSWAGKASIMSSKVWLQSSPGEAPFWSLRCRRCIYIAGKAILRASQVVQVPTLKEDVERGNLQVSLATRSGISTVYTFERSRWGKYESEESDDQEGERFEGIDIMLLLQLVMYLYQDWACRAN